MPGFSIPRANSYNDDPKAGKNSWQISYSGSTPRGQNSKPAQQGGQQPMGEFSEMSAPAVTPTAPILGILGASDGHGLGRQPGPETSVEHSKESLPPV